MELLKILVIYLNLLYFYQAFDFLDIETIFNEEKRTKQISGIIKDSCDIFKSCIGVNVKGYEIHNGVTNVKDESIIFIKGENDEVLGVYNKEKKVLGTYLHGIFDEKEFLLNFINDIRVNKGLDIIEKGLLDYRVYKLNQYDELAKIFEENINIRRAINI